MTVLSGLARRRRLQRAGFCKSGLELILVGGICGTPNCGQKVSPRSRRHILFGTLQGGRKSVLWQMC
jgi:hypothetical protein